MIKFIIISLSVGCMVGSVGKVEEEITVKNIPFRRGNNLTVTTKNGGIDIHSWDKEEIKIEATKGVRGYSKREARELLSEIKVNISENKKGVSIETEIPETKRGDIWVNYKIYLPQESNLTAQSKNGKISVESIKGEVEGKTKNGSICFKKVVGNIKGETKNGSIQCEIDTLLGSFDISLQTKNGDISLQIQEFLEPSIYAKVQNGKINSDFPIYTNEDALKGKIKIKLKTMNGSIRISKSEK